MSAELSLKTTGAPPAGGSLSVHIRIRAWNGLEMCRRRKQKQW
ncbi:MAG: hypothetical protein WAW23_02475 [Candidatus Methanoperedens sp.]